MKVALTSAIVGSIFGAVSSLLFDSQILQPRELQRNATNDFVVLFNGSFIGEHRAIISEFVRDQNKSLIINKDIDRRGINDKILDSVSKNDEIINSILVIAGFYRQLYFCIENQICDEQYVKDLFGANAREFDQWFSFVIRNLERTQNYDALDDFIARIAGYRR